MKQSLLASWIETLASTATGFAISLALQYVVCWWYGLALQIQDNLAIIGLFTVASLLRGIAWRRLMEKLHVRRPLSAFMQAVIAERYRQREVEGYDAAHDAAHSPLTIAQAGAAYLFGADRQVLIDYELADEPTVYIGGRLLWPWSIDTWKPRETRRNLVRGCALGIAAGELNDIESKIKRPSNLSAKPLLSTDTKVGLS